MSGNECLQNEDRRWKTEELTLDYILVKRNYKGVRPGYPLCQAKRRGLRFVDLPGQIYKTKSPFSYFLLAPDKEDSEVGLPCSFSCPKLIECQVSVFRSSVFDLRSSVFGLRSSVFSLRSLFCRHPPGNIKDKASVHSVLR